MSVFVIPRSQMLRFVRIDNYPTGDSRVGQTFDNRLLMDELWQTPETVNEYLQKVAPQDPVLIQFTTDYNIANIIIQLCNQNGNIISTDFRVDIMYSYSDGSDRIVYNALLNQAHQTFNGFYYVQIIANDSDNPYLLYQSESFEFQTYYNVLPYIQCQKSDRDGIYWDEASNTIFGIRAEIHMDYDNQSEDSIYEGFNFEPITEFSVARRMWSLTSDPIPRYLAEKLQLFCKHYNIWINAVTFNANGQSSKVTKIDRSNLYNFSISLIETNYEDYSILEAIPSGTVVSGYLDYDNAFFVDFDGTIFNGL
jgi:hypothetical protein